MEGGTEKVQEKVAWYKRDKERIRSRFEALYQVYRAGGGDETLPEYDKSDVKEFIKSQPLQGSRLQTLNTIGKICGVAAAVGGVGSILMSYRAVKSPGLAVLSGVLGATATSLAADDVCSWAYSTWKFDGLATREAFAEWIIQRKLAEAEAEAEGELPIPFKPSEK